VLGTGLACNVVPYLYNNAYTIEAVAAAANGTVDCAGKHWSRSTSVWRSLTLGGVAPALTIIPFTYDQTASRMVPGSATRL